MLFSKMENKDHRLDSMILFAYKKLLDVVVWRMDRDRYERVYREIDTAATRIEIHKVSKAASRKFIPLMGKVRVRNLSRVISIIF
ncbi:hypothetical protein AKJ37_01550 [candidate division MSBL1 archaeon SCGC-AAA259I09]|uniref:Uncharacterized protein n=1 Tax=candidate division MSBL1 archaeon SCGC-AAA259I09 TaxID=1698267 RepID=A0A133UV33_9EURY|nr:hypothetical protein AKJ37_01550 [candidate division MSBL1 archaeon SCGC-AAA259I09]